MVELDHSFSTSKPLEESWNAILDLDRVIPAVEGGRVLEKTGPDSARAEIRVKMGAMSMTFAGTVEITDRDEAAHRAVVQVKSREVGGSGYANADVTFTLSDGGGTIHTAAQITGKAASMGEGVVQSVLEALIDDFTTKLGSIQEGRVMARRTMRHLQAESPDRRRHRGAAGSRSARVPRQRPRRLRVRQLRQRARGRHGRRLHDTARADPVRSVPYG